MATTKIKVSGIGRFFSLAGVDKYEKHSLALELTEGSKAVYEKSGLKLKEQEDNRTGKPYTIFRRDPASLGYDKNPIGRPTVLSADGGKLDAGQVPDGSRVTVLIDVYDTQKGKGHRFNTVVVHEKGKGSTEDDRKSRLEYVE